MPTSERRLFRPVRFIPIPLTFRTNFPYLFITIFYPIISQNLKFGILALIQYRRTVRRDFRPFCWISNKTYNFRFETNSLSAINPYINLTLKQFSNFSHFVGITYRGSDFHFSRWGREK